VSECIFKSISKNIIYNSSKTEYQFSFYEMKIMVTE